VQTNDYDGVMTVYTPPCARGLPSTICNVFFLWGLRVAIIPLSVAIVVPLDGLGIGLAQLAAHGLHIFVLSFSKWRPSQTMILEKLGNQCQV